MHAYTHTYIQYMHTHMNIHIHTNIHTCKHTYPCTCIQNYTYMYAGIIHYRPTLYICTHACRGAGKSKKMHSNPSHTPIPVLRSYSYTDNDSESLVSPKMFLVVSYY